MFSFGFVVRCCSCSRIASSRNTSARTSLFEVDTNRNTYRNAAMSFFFIVGATGDAPARRTNRGGFVRVPLGTTPRPD